MSSIGAIWVKRGNHRPAALISNLLTAQHLYGPDAHFAWSDSQLALGGNLLRLLPEDSFDAQPLWSPDRQHCLVADVRLDNRDDLIRELHLTQPETLADSAILFAAWQRWEEQCLQHLVGAFAFAVWTPALQRLFAARDHVGDRPLQFYTGPDFIAIASMPGGILALPGTHHGIDRERMIEALILAMPGSDRSFFQSIHRLPMGHFLRVTPDKVETHRYWNPMEGKPVRFARDADYPEAVRELLDRATAARLRSTRPIASLLSAGLDSSSVAASAAVQLARRGQRLTAFTAVPRAGFHGRGFHGRLPDEGPGAADVARMHPNIDHILVDSAGMDMLPTLRRVSAALDEPVQNGINILWHEAIAARVRAGGFGVLLNGDRGNATLTNNGLEALPAMFRHARWLKLARTVHRMRANGMISWREGLWRSTDGLLPRRLSLWLQRAGTFDLSYSAGNPQLLAGLNLRQRMIDEFFPNAADLAGAQAAFLERFDYGAYNAAFQATTGLDTRDPTCDRRLFDFCYNIPIEQYVVGSVHRSLVRRAMVGRLPPATLNRAIRGQQGADWYLSIADALPAFRAEAPLIEASPLAQEYLDLPRMRTLLDTFPSDGPTQIEASQSWGDALCRYMSFGDFLRRHE